MTNFRGYEKLLTSSKMSTILNHSQIKSKECQGQKKNTFLKIEHQNVVITSLSMGVLSGTSGSA